MAVGIESNSMRYNCKEHEGVKGAFIELLSSIIERNIIMKIKASPYFSVMIDKSTDVAF